MVGELKDRNLDMALVSFKPRASGIEARFVTRDELVLITSPKHAFAAKGSVQLGDLAKESILLMDVSRPSPWHDKVTDAFVRCNAPLNLTLENAPIETIKKMVAIGLGVGFVPLISVQEEIHQGDLSVVPVDGFRQERSVWLVRRKTVHSLAAKAFAQVAEAYGQRLELLSQGAVTPIARVAEAGQRTVAVLKRRP